MGRREQTNLGGGAGKQLRGVYITLYQIRETDGSGTASEVKEEEVRFIPVRKGQKQGGRQELQQNWG